MASINKHPESRFWHAFYRDAQGKQRSASTKIEHSPGGNSPKEVARKATVNRRLAQDVANRLEEAERGNPTEAHLRRVLDEISSRVNHRRLEFKQTRTYLQEWMQRAAKAKSWRTGLRYKKVVADFLESLGSKAEGAINDIAPRDIQHFVDAEAAAGKSGSSIRIAAKVLNIPFNLAMRQGLILTNPVPSVELPDAANESRAPFTWEQVGELLKVARGEWKTCILIAAFTGALFLCKSWPLPTRSVLHTTRPGEGERGRRTAGTESHPTIQETSALSI